MSKLLGKHANIVELIIALVVLGSFVLIIVFPQIFGIIGFGGIIIYFIIVIILTFIMGISFITRINEHVVKGKLLKDFKF